MFSNIAVLAAALLVASVVAGCESGGSTNAEAETPSEDARYEVSFPDGDSACDASSRRQLERWLERMVPFVEVPRLDLGVRGTVWSDTDGRTPRRPEADRLARAPLDTTSTYMDRSRLVLDFLGDGEGVETEWIGNPRHWERISLSGDAQELRREVESRLDGRTSLSLALGASASMEQAAAILREIVDERGEPTTIQFVLAPENPPAIPEDAAHDLQPLSESVRRRIIEIREQQRRHEDEYAGRDGEVPEGPLAEATTEAHGDCEELGEVFGTMTRADRGKWWEIWSNGLPDVWRACGCEPDIEFLTAMVLDNILRAGPVNLVEITLSPDGEPVEYRPDETWETVAGRLADHQGGAVYLKRADTAGPAAETIPDRRRGLGPGGGFGGPEPESDAGARIGEIEPEDVEVDGRLEPGIISRVVRQHRRELNHCFEHHLDEPAEASVEFTARWTVTAAGDVEEPKIEGMPEDYSEIEECLGERLGRFVFPEPRGGEPAEVAVSLSR